LATGESFVSPDRRIGVLLAAGPATWEPAALQSLGAARRRVVLVRRCLDVTDLLAAAATGTAGVAVVSDRLPGLDGDSVARLVRSGIRTVAVVAAGDLATAQPRLVRMGVARVLDEGAVEALTDHVTAAAVHDAVPEPLDLPVPEPDRPVPDLDSSHQAGRIVAVWGPHGAPGRTTVAAGLAGEAAVRGTPTLLLDADPYGGAVAQHLAVLDEVSGLLAAARLANAGQLDSVRLAGLARAISPRLRILTGLPRPDRWTEVRPAALGELLATARRLDEHVVVDTGFGLPEATVDPFGGAAGRDEITSTVLDEADCLVVVGSADPVGLTRLVRSLRDLGELRPRSADLVVVNRVRSTLGWSTREIEELVEQVAPRSTLAFLPDDRIAVDRALVSGRTLPESGDSPLRRALAEVARLVARAGGAAAQTLSSR
jgi:MinD-like ATPase involved in chromosome partitioning or flagellar assembly